MKRFAIFGAGGFGREMMPLLRQQLKDAETEAWDLVFVDDNPLVESLNNHRVLTYAEWLAEPATYRAISLAVANSAVREKLAMRCAKDNVAFVELRAANVVVLDNVQVGEGAILCPFTMLSSNVRIGRQFHANYYSYVAHDCIVGDFVTLAPGAKCNGNVVIEDHAYIGAGAILKQGKHDAPLVIGHGAVVGMGAVVTKSIPPGVTVAGNPAKLLKRSS